MTEDEDGIKILNKNGSVIRLNRDTINRWQVDDVVQWLNNHETFTSTVIKCFQVEGIDGPVLLNLTESDINDFRYRCGYELRCGELKKLWNIINNLQLLHVENKEHHCKGRHRYNSCLCNYNCNAGNGSNGGNGVNNGANNNRTTAIATCSARYENYPLYEWDCWIPDNSSVTDGYASNIPQEYSKTAISLAYSFVVTWITSFVMVIVHERVPDMQRYPPLPDIFLDNVPHIPWAFDMCEITGTVLFGIWVIVCIFHKYRMVLLRRFFALAGTVFLLRCVTMLITSLSVPGTHLQCNKKDYAIDDTVLDFYEALYLRISRAYTIWSGLGLSIQGVRTCGDYMFSGHTVTLTLLNFFITEYTPRNLYFLHTLTWLLNMFGIFFILAAHEHYSIDVFVAFYITSRLFLYYHTLANNQALMQRDSTRTRIWFPMFSYFESSVNGIIPNEYDNLQEVAEKLLTLLMDIKDLIMLTANRVWLEAPSLPIATGSGRFLPCQESLAKLRNSATSSTNWMLLKNLSSSSTLNSERSMRGIDSSLTTIPSKIATIATETGATTLANGNTSFMMVNHTIAKAQQQQLSDNNVIACTRKYSVNDFRNQLKKSINECEDDEKTMEEIGTIIKSATTIVATTSTTAAAILSHNNNNNSNNNDAKENAIGNLILQTTQELTKKNL